ncbi:hypothetical protein R3P38DRAFT_3057567 [Favolaschia claudopus]|uniref:Uncharacterized protein n=1 Tax=Favolaschia claudopus TaxID=2862362 RepID=A0AAW0A3A4_9AGAR
MNCPLPDSSAFSRPPPFDSRIHPHPPLMPPKTIPSLRYAHATRYDPSLPMTPEAAVLLRILCPRMISPPVPAIAQSWGAIPNTNLPWFFFDDEGETEALLRSACNPTPETAFDPVIVEDAEEEEEGKSVAMNAAGSNRFGVFPMVEEEDEEDPVPAPSTIMQPPSFVSSPFTEDVAPRDTSQKSQSVASPAPMLAAFCFNPFADEDDQVNVHDVPAPFTTPVSRASSELSSHSPGASLTSESAESPQTSLTSISASDFPTFFSPLCEAPVDPFEERYLIWLETIRNTPNILSIVSRMIDIGISSPCNAYIMARIAARLASDDDYSFAAQLGWETVRRFMEYWQPDGKWLLECVPCLQSSSSSSPGAALGIFLAYLLQFRIITPMEAHNCLAHILCLPHRSHSPCASVILTTVRALVAHSAQALVDWLEGEELTLLLFREVGAWTREDLNAHFWSADEKAAGLIKAIQVNLYEKLLLIWNDQPGTGIA